MCRRTTPTSMLTSRAPRVRSAGSSRRPRVTMLLENDLFPEDVRVRDEAQSLVAAGYDVRVIAPRGAGQDCKAQIDGVTVERYWLPMSESGEVAGLLAEYLVAHAQLFIRGMRSLLAGANFLHSHNPPDTLFPLALAARVLRRRFVFDEHDLFPGLCPGALRAWPALAHRRLREQDDDSQRRHRVGDQRHPSGERAPAPPARGHERSSSFATVRISRP